MFFKELQAEFGWSRTTISGASSLAFFVMGAIGPLMAGRIFDLTGSYRLVFLIHTAMALIGFILITTLHSPGKDVGGI